MTEDEIEEKSFKAILPSESHRKRAKKHHIDNMSVTSDEGSGIYIFNTSATECHEHSFALVCQPTAISVNLSSTTTFLNF